MHKTIIRLLFTLSSMVTIFSYIEPDFTKDGVSVLKIGFDLFVVAFLILALIVDIMDLVKTYRKTFNTDSENFNEKINKYMRNWIKQGAKTVIVTRDMSWANLSPTRSLLLEKARLKELVICLPKDIPLSEELRGAGAEIYTYPKLGYVLKSRFTIVRQGQAGSQVAVGMGFGSQHVIEEYQEGSHPCYATANDLVEVIMRISQLDKVVMPSKRSNRKTK